MKRRLAVLTIGLCLAAFAAALAAGDATAATPDDDAYRSLNRSLVEHHAIPRYRRLAETTEILRERTEAICAAPDKTSVDALRPAFVAAAGAWQDVQHIRFGPIEGFMRNMRFAFWPDPRDRTSQQLDELLAAEDATALEPRTFDRATVSVQGLPAMERLLYGDEAAAKLAAGDSAAAYRCAVLRAIAGNLAAMAADLVTEWTTGEHAFAGEIERTDGHYQAPAEATLDFFKAACTAVELAADHKLARPLGPSAEAARPRLAEAWRSGLSMDNIRRNVAAAEALYLGEDGGEGMSRIVRDVTGDVKLDDLMRRAFAQTRATAESIPLPLTAAVVDPAARKAASTLATETAALKALLTQRVAPALGLQIGFNSLDGD